MITDRAFDQLMAIYEQDRILWAAVYAVGEALEYSASFGDRALMSLCSVHGIDPDQE